jgi:hypothetical protein
MLNLRTWEPVTYHLDAEKKEPITFKVKRLQFIEAEGVKLILASAIAAMEPTLVQQQAIEEAREAAENEARAAGASEKAIEKAGDTAAASVSLNLDPQKTVAALRDTYKALPHDEVERAFKMFVKDVEGLSVDGVEIVTGEQLFSIADEQLVFFVLGWLRRFAKLSVTEGKDSSSSQVSTSTETGPSSSPASSTSGEGGPLPSDATVVPETVSSIAGV